MRRKITEPSPALAAEDLPDLTPQQMAFVKGILDGKTASDAYRAAYNCENSTNNTVWCCASRLRNDIKVSRWLAASRIAGLDSAKCTMEDHLAELKRLRELAITSGNLGAAVQAEQCRGKAAGHYVDKVQDVTRTDPAETLEEIAKLSPELARALAIQANVSLAKH